MYLNDVEDKADIFNTCILDHEEVLSFYKFSNNNYYF